MSHKYEIEQSIRKHIIEAFKPDGWLCSKGFNYLDEQFNYALSVVDFLFAPKDKPIALLEADTGIGKTIGYLLPALVFSAMTRERVVISTYTIRLQNQILAQDLNIAKRYLFEKTLPDVTTTQRIGRSHFVDPSRVDLSYKLRGYGSKLTANHKFFLDWAKIQSKTGSGLLKDWLEEYGEFPEGINTDGVCLTAHSARDSNAGFLKHKLNAKQAQVVITSHACMYENLRQKGALFSNEANEAITNIIFDEAHHLPSVANIHGDKRIPIKSIVDLAKFIYSKLASDDGELNTIFQSVLSNCEQLETFLKLLDSQQKQFKTTLRSDQLSKKEFNSIRKQINLISSDCKYFLTLCSVNESFLEENVAVAVEELDSLSIWLNRYGRFRLNRFEGVEYSGKARMPSLVSVEYLPGRRIRQYLAGNVVPSCRLLLTSATLSETCQMLERDTFTDLRVELGITQSEIFTRQKFFPYLFGTMEFVLPDKQIPKPVTNTKASEISQIIFDKKWVIYICKMIIEAGKKQRGVLVLCHSFAEVRTIKNYLGENADIYFHLPETPVRCGVDKLKKSHGILVSPGLSEGFSERKSGGEQLFKDLIVTRLPFNPPSVLYQEVFVDHYLKNVCGSSLNTANQALYAKRQGQALRKFRQQLGRGLRKFDDTVTVWIGDPRFPYPTALDLNPRERHAIFRGAIPKRFEQAYMNALVYTQEGELGKALQEESLEDIVL